MIGAKSVPALAKTYSMPRSPRRPRNASALKSVAARVLSVIWSIPDAFLVFGLSRPYSGPRRLRPSQPAVLLFVVRRWSTRTGYGLVAHHNIHGTAPTCAATAQYKGRPNMPVLFETRGHAA